MKKRVFSRPVTFCLFAICAVAVSFCFLPAKTRAQEGGKNLHIVIVDVQKILAEAKAAKSIQKQIDDQRKAYEKEVDKQEEVLRETEKKLVDERNKVGAEEYAKKRQAFESDVLEARKAIQDKRVKFEAAAGEGLSKLRTELLDVIDKMAAEKGYDMILSRQNVMLVDISLDITDEVRANLDKKISEIKLDFNK